MDGYHHNVNIVIKFLVLNTKFLIYLVSRQTKKHHVFNISSKLRVSMLRLSGLATWNVLLNMGMRNPIFSCLQTGQTCHFVNKTFQSMCFIQFCKLNWTISNTRLPPTLLWRPLDYFKQKHFPPFFGESRLFLSCERAWVVKQCILH